MEGKEAAVSYDRVSVIAEEDGTCRFVLTGELDHHSVKEMREVIDATLIDHRPMRVVLDLNEVSFTDSAGLGLILGRYTRISGYGGTMRLIGVSEEFMKILRLAGTDRFLTIERRNGTAKNHR
ncbi:MAG: STAS domain-containing protein [Ruminococcaceae bacterium]|nr:STAS domain-containing protein [Oscillospiraceae bacterium]